MKSFIVICPHLLIFVAFVLIQLLFFTEGFPCEADSGTRTSNVVFSMSCIKGMVQLFSIYNPSKKRRSSEVGHF